MEITKNEILTIRSQLCKVVGDFGYVKFVDCGVDYAVKFEIVFCDIEKQNRDVSFTNRGWWLPKIENELDWRRVNCYMYCENYMTLYIECDIVKERKEKIKKINT